MNKEDLADRVDAIRKSSEIIVQTLKEMIYEAELKLGQHLVQENIARMFEVSRAPVRDALQKLINIGLAVKIPRRGVIVRPLSQRLLEDLFEIRKILEGSAIKMITTTISSGLFNILEDIVEEQTIALNNGDAKQSEKLESEFHRSLYGAAGNTTLVELIFANWERIKQARCTSTVFSEHERKWVEKSIKRHKKILDALSQKDKILSYRLIIENIEISKQKIISCLEKLGCLKSDDLRYLPYLEPNPSEMKPRILWSVGMLRG